MENLQNLIELAKEVAVEAGEMLRQKRESLKQINEELAHDFKTEADQASERLIRSHLESTSLPIVGEEYGGDIPEKGLYWVVDPLDGTVNYVNGIQCCSVSIGLMEGLKPIGGVVYDFWHKKMYWALKGHGAWLNNERLQPNPYERRSNQILSIAMNKPGIYPEELNDFMQTRNFYCGSLEICYVAEGITGAAFYRGFWLWDWAGASALLEELGYRYEYGDFEGSKPLQYRYKCFRELI